MTDAREHGPGEAGRKRRRSKHRKRTRARRGRGHDQPQRSPQTGPGSGGAYSVARSSAVMALGTLASRVTGFARIAVLGFALGTALLGDAYHTANTIPNAVYELLLGGILTSVVVPLLVRAGRREADQGQAYEQRLITLVTLVLLVFTVAAVIAAGPLISLYARRFTEPQYELAVTLARFFLPQIFFYGVTAMVRASLNTRDHFAAPMWTPVVNNLVVISVAAGFLAITSGGTSAGPGAVTPAETWLLGAGTTLGIVLQTAALAPALRAVGFRWRPRFDLGRLDYHHIGTLAGWLFGFVLVNQLGLLIVTNLATAAGVQANVDYGAGYTPYMYAFLLFSLPYAVVAVSVITALLPRMSGHAEEQQFHLVRDDFSTGVRLTSVLIVPAAIALMALGPQIAVAAFAHFRVSVTDAVYIGYVLAAFAPGLIGFSVFQLMLRVFYACQDTRSPALIAVLRVAVMGSIDAAAFVLLPPAWIVVGMGLGYSVSYYVAAAASGLVLRRRLGGIDGRRVLATLLRLLGAALPGGLFAYAMALIFTRALEIGPVTSLFAILTGATGGGLLYVLLAIRLGIGEVQTVLALLRRRMLAS